MFAAPPKFRLALALLAAASACPDGLAQPAAGSKGSPFLPPAAAGAITAAAPGETLEFAGISSVGKRTDLIFHDKSTKKSHWVGIGETKEGITVLNYDSRLDQVVIKWNGAQKTLALRKGATAAGRPAGALPPPPAVVSTFPAPPAPSPIVMAPPAAPAPAESPAVVEAPPVLTPKPAGPPVPETQLKQETEARMLVSDLLEIGMAQRKAYEEAQRKAAQSDPNPAAPPPEAPKQP
jgi:hypothetical protein